MNRYNKEFLVIYYYYYNIFALELLRYKLANNKNCTKDSDLCGYGEKCDLSLDTEGYGYSEKMSFETYNESTHFIEAMERFKERTFTLGKCCYDMKCITIKLEESDLTFISLFVFEMNLFKIQKRILCVLLCLL